MKVFLYLFFLLSILLNNASATSIKNLSEEYKILGPEIVCKNTPTIFSTIVPKNMNVTWSITYGKIIGTNKENVLQAEFYELPKEIKSYKITAVFSTSQNEEVIIAQKTKTILPLHIDSKIIIADNDKEDSLKFESSSIAQFHSTYLDGEQYDWYIPNSQMGSIIKGQGTPNIQIQWNELPYGVTSQFVNIDVYIKKCNQIIGSAFIMVEITGNAVRPNRTFCNPKEEIDCPQGDFTIVDATGNLAKFICQGCPVTLKIDPTTYNPDYKYTWSWSLRRNKTLQPTIVPHMDTSIITLHIENGSGRHGIVEKNIAVDQVEFIGEIIKNGSYGLNEEPVILSYELHPFNLTLPVKYRWLLNGKPAPSVNNTDCYRAEVTGIYSLEIWNEKGSKVKLKGINVYIKSKEVVKKIGI